MARASIGVTAGDGGIGYTGPLGPSAYAAIGVSSKAIAIADQEPITISNPRDVLPLIGRGPLRDNCVTSLQRSGGTIVVVPLERATGGVVIGGATPLIDGALEVTPSATSYALGEQEVRLEVVLGGAEGTAVLRLVVDGVPGAEFTPDATDYGSNFAATVLTDAVLGTLVDGVPAASRFTVSIDLASPATVFVAGESVTMNMSTPLAAGAGVAPAITKISDHQVPWSWIALVGATTPATWALLQTAIRVLPAQGRYVHGHVQAAGHDLRTGATTAVTMPTHVSDLAAGLTGAPARVYDPVLSVGVNYVNMPDPITGREKIWPAIYPLMGHIAARQNWQHPDATKYGPLRGVTSIYGGFSGPQADTLDDLWYTTLMTYPGKPGVYPTHVRMWGIYPQTGVLASDFTGVERRRVMDAALTSVYNALFPFINSEIATTPAGRMSEAEKTQWAGRAINSLRRLRQDGAITFASATVQDKDPGILVTGTVQVTVRITPRGKAEVIEGTVTFFVSEEVAAAEAEAA